jgi:hypothetical protein
VQKVFEVAKSTEIDKIKRGKDKQAKGCECEGMK